MDINEDANRLGPEAFRPGSSAERLSDEECWALLSGAGFGRLAAAAVKDIDIFPINFAVDGRSIVFRTAEGTKLLEMMISDVVAVEADHRNPATGIAWSVVAKGTAQLLQAFSAIYAAERLDIRPWVDGPKDRFVRVTVHSISGRRFRAAQPSSDTE
jgi:hypothetical protein